MKLTRIAAALAIFFIYSILIISCATPDVQRKELLVEPYQGFSKPLVENPNPAIIRLMDGNNFFCTGFVIDDNYAITAAHCVDDNLGGIPKLKRNPITIASIDGYVVGQAVYAAGINSRLDYAILRGDFSTFEKVKIDTVHPPTLYSQNYIYTACGFPSGQKQLVCVELKPIGNEYFHVKARGNGLYPGMSGGPVFDNTTNTVVGVNSYVGNGYVAFGSLVGLLAEFGIE